MGSIMIEVTLADYAKQVSQKVAANTLNVSSRAIRKAIHSDRKIIVRMDDQGTLIAAYEVKDFGKDAEEEPAVL